MVMTEEMIVETCHHIRHREQKPGMVYMIGIAKQYVPKGRFFVLMIDPEAMSPDDRFRAYSSVEEANMAKMLHNFFE